MPELPGGVDKAPEQMKPGDNLVYYVSKVQAFGATARVEKIVGGNFARLFAEVWG